MERILIQTAPGLWPMLEYELDIVQQELDSGNNIIFLHCRGDRSYCGANNPKKDQVFRKRICSECISRVETGIKWLDVTNGKLEIVGYGGLKKAQKNTVAEIIASLDCVEKNEKAIQKIININGVDIFDIAKSSVMTRFRDSISSIFTYWDEFLFYVESGLIHYHLSINWLKRYHPDKVYIYNARISLYRPLLRVSQQSKLEIVTYEYPRFGYERYIPIGGTYIHDNQNYSKLLRDKIDNSGLAYSEMLALGSEWFKNKTNKINQGFGSVFSDLQEYNKMPSQWSDKQFNIVFFVSSQDEMYSIEENVIDLPYGQVEAILNINKAFPEEFLYVRIHPNLRDSDHLFIENLQALDRLKMVTIINAESQVDSYELVKKANLVITYGSTIGDEAAFQKKPVISIGFLDLAQKFNCVKTTIDHSELMALIQQALKGDFSSFPTEKERYEGACLFAWSAMNFGVKPKYLKKKDLFGGYMVRDGIKTKISASIYIKLYNRLLDFPVRVFSAFSIIINDSSKWEKFKKAPLESIKNRFFGELP